MKFNVLPISRLPQSVSNFCRYFFLLSKRSCFRMMRQLGIQGRIKHRYTVTTKSRHSHCIYPNFIKEKTVTGINQVWCSDITYIRILTGFVYLAVIIDIYSRRIVGYALGRTLSPELTLAVLKMALATRKIDHLIHHSDQGVQYASTDYTNLLKEYGIRISMFAKGNPYDNAFAESLIKTLKQEEVYLWQYETFSDVAERIPYFILDVYDRKRLHTALGYRPPEEFESLLTENASTVYEEAKALFV